MQSPHWGSLQPHCGGNCGKSKGVGQGEQVGKEQGGKVVGQG